MFLTSDCPYCHQPMSAVEADAHITGCAERWRQQHHVHTPAAPGACPRIEQRWSPEPATAGIESAVARVRRAVVGSDPLSGGFRSLPAYEPAA